MSVEVGLRELRQNASELVRQAESGTRVTITVAGRAAAVLGPVGPRAWRSWDDLADLFRQPADRSWAADRDLVDGDLGDPWERA
ncbi:type II toxin-antitoxin system Phd/YefM family antitoxin [Pilimelia terevasa]|uniref:type II toxin-antitoxin system Phd/YefM family antitoxin n=1 Tax=Pilimelia terevasa TaxID=53372 RepID=UPI0016693DAA|nr:type II toxin-antitoxin system prevent-host-death family antitoxin [Pilimelia terevasa]